MAFLLPTLVTFIAIFLHRCYAEFNLPRCVGADVTGYQCGLYGYDDTWNITNAMPKGVNINDADLDTQFINVNGTWPPPTITVNVTQRIRIQVINNLDEAVTLHFHGILQENGYNVMDGPQGLVQSGILPGKTFTYDFPASKAGTFWIHSHVKGQYPKGLRSPLIVQDPSDPANLSYDVGQDVVFTVSDWWQNFWKIERLYDDGNYNIGPQATPNCGDSTSGLEVPPSQIIVNDNCTWNNSRSQSYYIPAGVKSRIRFINLSAYAEFYVFFSDHRFFDVIELDGVLVQKSSGQTNGFSIASGQRVSITLDRKNDPLTINTPGATSLRIFFLSNPRINAGVSSNCELNSTYPTKLPQYAVGYIDSTLTNPTREPVLTLSTTNGQDVADNNDPLRYLQTWSDSDTYANPFYKYRPKVPSNYDQRDNNAGGITYIPTDIFNGFTDVNYQSRDGVGPWVNPASIHRIIISAHKGVSGVNSGLFGGGQMGATSSAISYATTDNLFFSPESAPNSRESPLWPTVIENLLWQGWTSSSQYTDPADYSDGANRVSTGTQTIVMPNYNEVHWFSIRTLTGDHPIHMHGHEFQILARLPNALNADQSIQDYTLNLINDATLQTYVNAKLTTSPVRRDTILVEKGWDYIIAIKSTNPGIWAFHCHNDFHASTGMFMQLVEAPSNVRLGYGYFATTDNTAVSATCPETWRLQLSTTGSYSAAWNQGQSSAVMWPPIEQLYVKSFENYGWGDLCPLYPTS